MDITLVTLERTGHGGLQALALTLERCLKDLGHTVRCASPTYWRSLTALWHAEIVVLNHAHLLPLALLVPPRRRVILIANGIEVWRPQTFWQRLGYTRVTEIWSISAYTRERMNPYLNGKPNKVLSPCVLS